MIKVAPTAHAEEVNFLVSPQDCTSHHAFLALFSNMVRQIFHGKMIGIRTTSSPNRPMLNAWTPLTWSLLWDVH